jgi:hypothetical protein
MKQELVDLGWIFFSLLGVAGVAGGWRSGKVLAGSVVSLAIAFALWHFFGVQ